jgi:hypothetical protein
MSDNQNNIENSTETTKNNIQPESLTSFDISDTVKAQTITMLKVCEQKLTSLVNLISSLTSIKTITQLLNTEF